MPINQFDNLSASSILRRQIAACSAFLLFLAFIVTGFYAQDRSHELTLRIAQVYRRLDESFELLSNDIERVQADILFLADQESVRGLTTDDDAEYSGIANEYTNFLRRKQIYNQIRLLDLRGHETIRVNYSHGEASTVARSDLQDKSNRYYYRKALSLHAGDVFVSEFDLNLEHGQIEIPLNPVIRFVTPVANDSGAAEGFLVLNYRGARLLSKLENSTVPGLTMLLRTDGNYILGPSEGDSWGWILGHGQSFAAQFAQEWSQIDEMEDFQRTPNGLFAKKTLLLGRDLDKEASRLTADHASHDPIIVVSHIPSHQLFVESNKSLKRLLSLAACVFLPVAIFARYWAHTSLSRQLQAKQIAASEERLRELSSRLLQIQEDERRAISREIHDELGQQVTAINLDLKLADRNIESGKASSHLKRAIKENEGLLQTLHTFATRVRPAVLDDLGLRDALESHLWEFQERTSIEVDAALHFQSASISNELAGNVYRLLQESLNNVAKHADASKVNIVMSTVVKDSSRTLCITISDDGQGYDPNSGSGQRLGLVGMQERVDLLAGDLQVFSGKGEGTRIEIRLPLLEQSANASEEHV